MRRRCPWLQIPSSLETSHQPVDFLIESPPRILRIDWRTDVLVAVRHGPAHPSLGIEYGQPDSRPVVLESAVAPEDPRNNAIADQYRTQANGKFRLLRRQK
jgi:hypothetical protein